MPKAKPKKKTGRKNIRRGKPVVVPKTVDASTITLAVAAVTTCQRDSVTVTVLERDFPTVRHILNDNERVLVEDVGPLKLRLTPKPLDETELQWLEDLVESEFLDDELVGVE